VKRTRAPERQTGLQEHGSFQTRAAKLHLTLPRPLPPPPPTYESRFGLRNGMTEEYYNELEDENKWDFVRFFVEDSE
jgi:hypothetical protein